ncbi:MAG: hypothetical protein D6781_00400 [Verrucomicrobia bacterium]|nr:MAG: hypothetical protein D6781_00400 [Verrucomicrobiota bacterium]
MKSGLETIRTRPILSAIAFIVPFCGSLGAAFQSATPETSPFQWVASILFACGTGLSGFATLVTDPEKAFRANKDD